jgi:hypothetical protein
MSHSERQHTEFPIVTENSERRPGPTLNSGEPTEIVFEVTTEYADGRKGSLRILSSAFVSQKE